MEWFTVMVTEGISGCMDTRPNLAATADSYEAVLYAPVSLYKTSQEGYKPTLRGRKLSRTVKDHEDHCTEFPLIH